MNQILVTDVENNNQSNGKMKPVIKYFCIALIIFVLVLIGEAIFLLNRNGKLNWFNNMFNNKKQEPEYEYVETRNETENNKDTAKPEISIENTNGKLVVTAKDETELDYLSYKWENADEVVTKPTEENKLTVVQDIEVQKGTLRLTLKAVDKAGNVESVTKKIIGSNGPEINVSISEGNFVVKVTDDFEITKIVYTLNEEEHTVEGIPQGAKEYEFKVPVKEGDNYLKINAYENGIMTEFKGKKTR